MSAAKSEKLGKPAHTAYRDKEDSLGPVPTPLSADPAARAELRQRLERGLSAARSGIGEDWEVVHARVRARLNLPPLTDPSLR